MSRSAPTARPRLATPRTRTSDSPSMPMDRPTPALRFPEARRVGAAAAMILAAACDRGVDVRPAPDAAPLAAVTREVAAAGPDAAGVAPSVAGPRAAPSLRVTQARSAIH